MEGEGNNLLHLIARYLASEKGGELYFKSLLSFGLLIDAKNRKGETPLFLYMAHSSIYMERLPSFTDAGADVFTANKDGQNLLHVIAGKRPFDTRNWGSQCKDLQVEMFKWLIKKGLDSTSEDVEQRTPVDLAVAAENHGILSLFERKE